MSKQLLIAIVFLFCFLSTNAADGEYAVSKIDTSLLKNANAIIRLETLKFEVVSTRQAVYTNHYVITILNENADYLAGFQEYYDKNREITSVEGILYDALGKKLKSMKNKDLIDLSGVSGSNLIDDNRVKQHSFYYKVYPYTIDYTVEINYKSTLFFPMWAPRSYPLVSVEKSEARVVCVKDYKFRYKAFKYSGEPIITQEKNNTVYTWAMNNMPAIQREPYSPLWHELTTVVIFGPTDFQMEDYKGNMMSWQDFGKFVYSLKEGKDQLPDNIKQTVHRITNGINDPREKIAMLYEYMQKNTRYISIQLGIGGWQPFDAAYVATKGYGDCKALANYMYSLLKEAGITSYYTLVRAGKNKGYITDDFPSQQFNHVILCVPLQNDTTWLECTSQTMPAGYLGDFTCNRYALLINEQGGKLIRTPRYGMKENQEIRQVKAVLDNDATLHLKTETIYGGLQQDLYHELINGLSKDKLKEFLHEQLDFATYDITDFSYQETKSALPAVKETLDIIASNYATITGKRLFIIPNVMSRSNRKASTDTARKFDLVMNDELHEQDNVEIALPAGYSPESVPKDVKIESEFGTYTASVKLSADKIIYSRSLELNSGHFPAKDYPELVKYYDAVYKADRNKVVLVKN